MERWDMFCRASAAWPVAVLAAFELPVLGPLVQPGWMTCCHDSMLHLGRPVGRAGAARRVVAALVARLGVGLWLSSL